MNKTNQSLSLFLSIAILLTISFSSVVCAVGGFEISLTESESVPAGEVSLDIVLKNNPGFNALNIALSYNDDYLQLKSVENKVSSLYMSKGASIVWDGAENYVEDGILATVIFTIADTAPIGEYEIKLIFWGASNEDFEEVTATAISGKIDVVCLHDNTTNVPENSADCDEGGYTEGVWCNDCETYISGHEPTSATGEHIDADGNWEKDDLKHFHTCSCGHVFDTADHDGGTATCETKAKCSACGAEYGNLNATNHAGGTTIANSSAADHKTQTNGYTGDTQCLGCGEIIEYGKTVPASAHTPSDAWATDGTYHWKECSVAGCDVVIDSSKAMHKSDKDENKATCQKQAVCDDCGISYGTVANHDYTAEQKKPDALKTEGNCCDEAVYYYSCSVCGLVEGDDNHVFHDDKVATNHAGGTTIVNVSAADHKTQTNGYTGDTQCLGCGEIIEYGKTIPASAHTPSDAWATDGTHHWKECSVAGCDVVIDSSKAMHKSDKAENKATCQKRAVCDDCGVSYGDIAEHDFADALSKDESGHWHACQTAGCNEREGVAQHTPDREAATEIDPIKCSDCGYEIAPVLPHTHEHGSEWKYDEDNHWNECACGDKANVEAHKELDGDGKCDICEYVASEPDNDIPKPGDNSMISLWFMLLCTGGLGIAVTIIYRKKIMF